MTRLTKVATLAASILRQMPQIGKWQRGFLLHLFVLWLSIRGRHNFANLARYGIFGEGAYRNNFAKPFDWLAFNRRLCQQALSTDLALAFDPSYLVKSGHHTEGVAKYWSGCAGQVKHGLEISGVAAIDLETSTALHLVAFQTLERAADQTLLDYYAEGIIRHGDELKKMSRHVIADAYFSKAPFVQKLTGAGFELISRLRTDARLRYLYTGPARKGKGRPRQYDGMVDARQLRRDIFDECGRDEQGKWIAYTAVVNIQSWKRKARVVIIHQLDDTGDQVISHRTFVSTDTELSGQRVLAMYPGRFQQEFLYRDAKQDLGLEHCQAYTAAKIDFHVNAALSVGSLAKVAHHLSDENERNRPFSIADVKTEYVNEHQVLRILSMCNIDVDLPIIKKLMPEFRNYGKRRA